MSMNTTKNKNQTAVERKIHKDLEGQRLTNHVCVSPKCKHPGEKIALKDLFPVQLVSPKKRMVFYHRDCYSGSF